MANALKERIINYLFDNQVNVKSRGFQYLIEMVELAIKDTKSNVIKIYEEVAKMNNLTWNVVERLARYSLFSSENKDTHYMSLGKFIRIAAITLKLEE